jgi:sugar lactone lactonase YvrE
MFAFVRPGLATDVDPGYRRATIRPSVVRLEPGRQQKFKVIMSPRYLGFATVAAKVKWAVNDIPGGNKKLGTIDANGLYTAPAKMPTPNEIHICAKVQEASNRYLWATVLFGNSRPAYKLVRTWSQPTYLSDPHGICLDKDGNLLIADQGNAKVLRFTPQGKFLGSIGYGTGRRPGELNEPRVVLTGPEGRIWVSDSKADEPRIQVFEPNGKFIRWFGHKGILPGQLFRVHGMEFDSKGRLFVVDVDNFRVNVYAQSGDVLYSWGKPGLHLDEFNAPHGLCIDPSDDVFVSDYFGPARKFDPNGNLLFAFAHADPPDGVVGLHSISGDKYGNIFITVQTFRGAAQDIDVVKYNNNGDFVTGWSMAEPAGDASWIAVDDAGLVYCLFGGKDAAGVQVFAPQ